MSVDRMPTTRASLSRGLAEQRVLRRAERNLLRCGRLPRRHAWRAPVWLAVYGLPPAALTVAAVCFALAAGSADRLDVALALAASALAAAVCAAWRETWMMELAHGFGATSAVTLLAARHDRHGAYFGAIGRTALVVSLLSLLAGAAALVAWRLRNVAVQRSVRRGDTEVVWGYRERPRHDRR